MSELNRVLTLAARPVGFPKESDFKLIEKPTPTPGDGQFLIKTRFVSVDPYMRGRMNAQRSYANPFEIGEPISGGAVGEIIKSNNNHFKVGSFVHGMWGWQSYAVSNGDDVYPVDPDLAPIQTSISVLGMTGMTAYFGFLEICKPEPGDSVFISGAAGAVGQLVGQIAKIKGCSRVIGSCGSDEKAEFLIKECGYDDVFNYKTNAYRFNSWLEAYNDATASLDAQDPEGAIELFNLANTVFDKRPEAYLNIGAQAAGLGDLEASIEAWNGAVAVIESPDADAGDEQTREQWDTQFWQMAHTNLGRVLQMAERDGEAVTVYQALLERFPDDTDARSALAMSLAASGQAGNALSIFDEILSREDGAPLDYFNAGVSLYTADQLDQATIGFEKAVERVPMYRDALQNLVQTLNVLEDAEAQIPYSERLLELDPHNEYGYQMHIRALVQVGRQADAVALLDIMRELPFVTDNLQLQPVTDGTRIAGIAVNKTLPPGTSITLRFTFYDNAGNPLGTEDTEITLSDPEVAQEFQLEFGAEEQVLGYGYEFLN